MSNLFKKTSLTRRFLAILLAAFFFSACEREEAKQTKQDLYLYQGKDRDQVLLEKAKQEGVVNIYTSLNTKDSSPIVDAFERQYGIKVALWRGTSDKVVQRALIEAGADRYDVDVLETSSPKMEQVSRKTLLGEFYSPVFKYLPPMAFPKHRQY